jgi:hypothetical protein
MIDLHIRHAWPLSEPTSSPPTSPITASLRLETSPVIRKINLEYLPENRNGMAVGEMSQMAVSTASLVTVAGAGVSAEGDGASAALLRRKLLISLGLKAAAGNAPRCSCRLPGATSGRIPSSRGMP